MAWSPGAASKPVRIITSSTSSEPTHSKQRNMFGFTKNKLRSYETAVVSAVESKMPPDGRHLLRKQIDSVNLVQRLCHGKEVDLYRMRKGRAVRATEVAFPNRCDEGHLARVRFQLFSGVPRFITADVWLVAGVMFSITFDTRPKQMLRKQWAVDRCELLLDVMSPEERSANQTEGDMGDDAVLRAFFGHTQLCDVRSPASNVAQKRFIDAWGSILPSDYIQLLRYSDGFVLNNWEFLGTMARIVVAEPDNLLVLAQHPWDGVLCVLQGRETAVVYRVDLESNQLTPIGRTFRDALTKKGA